MQSPYERFQALEAKRAREEPLSYCYARTREEHEPYFKGKDITQLKRWLENIRKNYDKLVDPVQGFIGHPDEREKADAWFNRMIYIEDEIEKRTKLFAPRNPKADAAMWRTKTKLLEERAAKRRKMEADAEAQPTCPPTMPFAPDRKSTRLNSSYYCEARMP